MRIIETKVYTFDELSEQGKQKAIENLSDINVHFDWWDCTYYDAMTIGLKITGFDIGRGNYCSGELFKSGTEVAHAILKNHGEESPTFALATEFLREWDNLVFKHSDKVDTERVAEGNEYDFDIDAESLERDFEENILKDYLKDLRNEYDYRTDDEAIIETITGNNYEFTEDGKLV